MRKIIALVVLATMLGAPVMAQGAPPITVVSPSERINDGPLFPDDDAIDLGHGVSLVYVYAAYDGLSAELYGELAVESGHESAFLSPLIQFTAVDTNGNELFMGTPTLLSQTTVGDGRVPFALSFQTNGYPIVEATATGCVDYKAVRPDIIAVEQVQPAGREGVFGVTYVLTNVTDNLPVYQPRIYFAGFNDDGVLVGSASSFYPEELVPGAFAKDDIIGADWGFATAAIEADAVNLTYVATAYPGNVGHFGDCGVPLAVTISDALPPASSPAATPVP